MKLSYKTRVETRLVARSVKREVRRSKEVARGKSIGEDTKGIIDLECLMRKVETRMVEDTKSNTGIVSDLGEGDGEIEIIVESTKIGEGREDGEGSREVMKERKARIAGEECG